MPTKEEIDKVIDDAKKCLDEYDNTIGNAIKNKRFNFSTDKKNTMGDVYLIDIDNACSKAGGGSGFMVSSYNNVPIYVAPPLKEDSHDLSNEKAKCSYCGKLHTCKSMKIMGLKDYAEDEIKVAYAEYESIGGRYRCESCTKKLEEQYRKDRRKDLKGISGKDLINRVIQLEKDDMFDHGRNIMGCPEAYYDPRYLVYYAYHDRGKLNELRKMSADEVKQLLLVARKASEVFY